MKKNKKHVIAYVHTHFDPEWYRTIVAFNIRLVEIVDIVLEELKNGNLPEFYFDGQVYALLNYLKFRPEKKNLIKKFIKEKKLFIGPFFASADNFLVSGAALIKNLDFGLKISSSFGQKDFIGYLSDTFGHSKGIFEILKFFNIKSAILWRGVSKDLPADFMANGVKTTKLTYGYYQDVLHSDISLDEKANILKGVLDKINKASFDTLLLPLGADHLAPFKNASFLVNEMNKRIGEYEISIQNPFEYFKRADFSKAKYDGEFLDNSETFILSGVYSARIEEKAKNARLQWLLLNKVNVLDKFLKRKYKKELDYAILELIKNHAHDSIYGCSTDEVHKMVQTRQLKAFEMADAVLKNLIRDFKKENKISNSTNDIGVFNLSNYPQDGVLRVITDEKIKNGQKIRQFKGVSDEIWTNIYQNPMTEDFHTFFEYLIEIDEIKPFSFKNLKIKEVEKRHIIGSDFIENDYLKLFILDNEIFVINKKTNKIYPNFIELHSTKDDGDSYNYAPSSYPSILKLKGSKIKTKGKIQSTLELLFEENIKLNVSITNKAEYFEFEADFINKKKNRKLQVVINQDKKITETIAEDAIGTIKRKHNPDYLLFDNMPAPPKKELKTNTYPMQRFVKTGEIGVITEGLCEYEIYKNSLKIALLRSVSIISNPKNQARSVPAGPPIECVDMQGLFEHKERFAITFKDDLFKLADSFFGPFVGVLGEFKIKNKTYLKNNENANFYGFVDFKKQDTPVFL